MSGDRTKDRRTNRRAFKPTLEGGLETRALLSSLPGSVFLKHTRPGLAFVHNQPHFVSPHAPKFHVSQLPRGEGIVARTAHGGQSVVIATPDGGHFIAQLTQFIPPAGEGTTASTTSTSPGTQNPIQGQTPGAGQVQPIGTIRAYAMPHNRVGFIIDGSTTETELDISPYPFPQKKGYAHSFAYGQTAQDHILNVGQISVNSGTISAILGYHTTNLSGPLIAAGQTPVDRIALNAVIPGGSIQVGGNLNTLDVLQGINLTTNPGISVSRDLNLLNVGQSINLTKGATVFIGRYLGETPQPPKGTATGSNILALNQALVGSGTSNSAILPSLSGYVIGNLTIGPGSSFTVLYGIANSSVTSTATSAASQSPTVFYVQGFVGVSATGSINIPNVVPSTSFTPPPVGINFVAQQGFDTI